MSKSIIDVKVLGFPWPTKDPFLFCAHHADAYPAGNDEMGPAVSLEGRNIGSDFSGKDGWSMYHGATVPGFPAHPHRGFETVTIVRSGLVDHSDSMGGAGRFGNGDVQWMTAGKGVQHAEMFPLLNNEKDNPFELFQIWLNLPKAGKLVEPYYGMLWSEDLPIYHTKDNQGKEVAVAIITGNINDLEGYTPPSDSWAAEKNNEIAIWTIKLSPGSSWDLPQASPGINRMLYFFKGDTLNIDGQEIPPYHAIELHADQKVRLENGSGEAHLLMLQGRPINEPVAQYGPFVMNTQEEIQQAIQDYQQTQFGGWPWPVADHVHPRVKDRFAKYPDGREETR